jgi:Acyl carrier protein phosphodiesterase
MSTVLYIKANGKPEGMSRTFQISDTFIEEYKKNNPGDKIITLDLYKEDIDFLKAQDIMEVFGPKTEASRKHPVLKYAYQFAEADKYVVAEPMWNLGIPAILKAYVDYISVVGITFRYTEHGAEGMLMGKKAINIVSRGGDYCAAPACDFELGDRYVRTIFGFFGIVEFTTIFADGLDIQTNDAKAIVAKAQEEAKQLAKSF